MKKLILIFTIAALSASLFAQDYTENLNVVTGFGGIISHTDAEVVLDATDCNNKIHFADGVVKFILPACQNGFVVAFLDTADAVVTVDLFDGVDKIWLEGADGGAGNEMESDGTRGRYIVLIGLDDTNWWALPIETLTWGIP